MSRRSLRLDKGLLDHSLPHSGSSFSVGEASWRSNRSLKPRLSQHLLSSSCSESLLNTPVKASGPSRPRPEVGGGLSSSVASDASLLSSLLGESSVQESTLVGTFWGLDADVDPKESTSLVDHSALVPDVLKHQRCEHQSVSTYRCTSKFTSSEPGTSSIYCRDRSLMSKTGVLRLWFLWVRRAAAGCVRVLTLTWQVCPELCSQVTQTENRRGARSGLCGVMDLKDLKDLQDLKGSTAARKDLNPDGPLSDVFRRLNKRWRHMTSSFLPTGFPPWLLLVLPLLLLLFFILCWVDPAVSETGTVVSGFVSFQSRPAEGTGEESRGVRPPAAGEEEWAEFRLVRLEENQAALWHHLEAGGQRADQRHTEVLQLYANLQQLVSDQNHREESGPWTRGLLDQLLDQQLSGGPDEDRWQMEKQQSQTSRLDQLELQLQTLAARTQEAPWRREAATSDSSSSSATLPAAAGGGVDPPSHDALLLEVSRLEAALEAVRRDVQGLSGCLDTIQPAVREEVRLLVYGNQLTAGGGAPGGGGGAPESLLQWLSMRYVSGADLQGALASLELKVLQHRGGEELREEEEEVLHATKAGVTKEDVREVVRNALRLFSEDRTGLADFALESGGGSVIRCSETHQAKVALYSLFGVPLWYFSQSPRAVIQPDVHPGNCWAFRGSAGFLVIRLSARILPTSFSLEHLPKALAPSRDGMSSAPRDFTVYGLQDEGLGQKKLLGSFTFDKAGEALQTFRVTEENDEVFQVIEIQVLTNWGHQEYTCLYRFRAHGEQGGEEEEEEQEEEGEEQEEEEGEGEGEETITSEETTEEEEEEEEQEEGEEQEEEEEEEVTEVLPEETPEEPIV